MFLEALHTPKSTPVERKKQSHKMRIIRDIYLKGPRSLTELSNKLAVSTPTTLSLINDLASEGIIEKQGRGESGGGRKPELYGLKPHSFFILGIDIRRYTTRIGIFDNHNKPVTEIISFPFEINKSASSISYITDAAHHLVHQSGISYQKLVGVGVSMLGLV